jgi:hypothetical protein
MSKLRNTEIATLIGQDISLKSWNYDEPGSTTTDFYVNGKLEAPDDDSRWYVRVKDCYQGSSGIGFSSRSIQEIYKQPSGRIEITLK